MSWKLDIKRYSIAIYSWWVGYPKISQQRRASPERLSHSPEITFDKRGEILTKGWKPECQKNESAEVHW